MAAIMVYQTSPLGVELYFMKKSSFVWVTKYTMRVIWGTQGHNTVPRLGLKLKPLGHCASQIYFSSTGLK